MGNLLLSTTYDRDLETLGFSSLSSIRESKKIEKEIQQNEHRGMGSKKETGDSINQLLVLMPFFNPLSWATQKEDWVTIQLEQSHMICPRWNL